MMDWQRLEGRDATGGLAGWWVMDWRGIGGAWRGMAGGGRWMPGGGRWGTAGDGGAGLPRPRRCSDGRSDDVSTSTNVSHIRR